MCSAVITLMYCLRLDGTTISIDSLKTQHVLITLAMLSKDGRQQQQPHSALRLTTIIGMQYVLIGEHYIPSFPL